MKKIIITLFVLAAAATATAQSFEGTITYYQDVDVSAKMKAMGLTREMMLGELKKKGDWFDSVKAIYRAGDYAQVGNGEQRLTKVYLAAENKIYTFKIKGDDMCAVQDAVDLGFDGNPDKPTVTEIDSTVTVMGIPCKIVRMKWSMSTMDYYYNAKQAKVDPNLFSKHSTEGLAEFVKRTKCLPLRTITSIMGAEIIRTATAIKPGKVNSDVFKIPTLVEDESLNPMKIPGIKVMRVKR